MGLGGRVRRGVDSGMDRVRARPSGVKGFFLFPSPSWR